MPYQYLTFSDLYEEEVRSSAPSSPVMTASSLSPVFLLPSTSPSHDSTSYRHSVQPSRSHSQHRRRDVHAHAMLKTLTQDSEDVAPAVNPSSSSSHSSLPHDLLRLFKRRSSKKSSASDSSAFSTPTSSRRSSFTNHAFFASTASSANTSPAISRQVTKNVSDYEAMVATTARQEQEEELERQRELQEYFNQAAESGLSLRRF